MHGPPRRPRRAAAPSPRLRQRWRRAPSSAQPPQPLGAIPADVQSPARQLARQLRGPPCESFARRALRRAGARRSPCSRMSAQRLRRARAGRRIRLAAAHVVDARAPRQQQQQRTCSARRLRATRVRVRAESARETDRVVRRGGRGRGLLSRVRSCTVATRHVREGGSWGGWGWGDWGWGERRPSYGRQKRTGSAGDRNDGGAELRAPTRGDAALACFPRAVPAPAPVASLVLRGWGDWGWGEGRP